MKIQPRLILSLLLLLCLAATAPQSQAVVPAPDGGYPGANTAEGQNALFGLTTGGYNTAVGYFSLRSDSTNSFNTAVGAGTLLANTADENTATGAGALLSNTAGTFNTANGAFALFSNTVGLGNTANGEEALFNNTEGLGNTADGNGALINNIIGNLNTADGASALFSNTGSNNTAVGDGALNRNTIGSNNIALGSVAGWQLTTGDYNIDIGNGGVAGESNTIRIGDDNQSQTFLAGVYGVSVAGLGVAMNSSGQLGTVGSSRRFKKDIKAMEQASETILSLNPVTFHYTKEIDPEGLPQYGLVAEDVEKVNPDLVVRDKEGKPYSVRYEQVNVMLLNEFVKEHKAFLEEHRKVEAQGAAISRQQRQIEALTAGLQKVSAHLELSNSAPETVLNNQ